MRENERNREGERGRESMTLIDKAQNWEIDRKNDPKLKDIEKSAE